MFARDALHASQDAGLAPFRRGGKYETLERGHHAGQPSVVLHNAFLECRGVHRTFGVWLPLALLLVGLAAWFQEPDVFRLSGVHLFWGAVRSLLMLALALVPLAWVLARKPEHQEWLQARARSRGALVLPPFLGMALYGALLVGGSVLIFITLDSISALPASPGSVAALALRALLFLLPLAALAPGLAARPWSSPTRILVFSGCVLGSLFLTAPGTLTIPHEYGSREAETQAVAFLAPLLATGAGILLSLSLVLRSN